MANQKQWGSVFAGYGAGGTKGLRGGFVIGQVFGTSSGIAAFPVACVAAGARSAATIAVTEHAASAVTTMDFADREADTTPHLSMIFFLEDVIAKEFVNASNRAHTHEIRAQLVTEGMGIGSPDDPKNCKSLRLFAISEWQVHGGTRESECCPLLGHS